jgi:pimeloyl-ACP methyl ester carboxylesterase
VTDVPLDGIGRQRVAVPPHAERLSLRSQDGIALSAMHLGHSEATTALVVAHGFGGAHDQERVERIARILSADAGVIAVTQRGHGDSQGLTTLGHREPLDIDAAAAWARRAGYERVVTIGFSMGAAVVLRHAALLGPGATDAVVAVSGPAYWFYRGTTPMRWLHRGISTAAGRAYIRTALGTRVDPTPWRELGERLGEAYQVADDIRDVLGTDIELGKPAHRDADLLRPSCVNELGVAGAVTHFGSLIRKANESIPDCPGAEFLRDLLDLEAERLLPAALLERVAA